MPALLANAAEAVLAAVFLDARASGGDGLAAVHRLADKYLAQPELPAMRAAVAAETGRALRDHKTHSAGAAYRRRVAGVFAMSTSPKAAPRT